MRSVSEFPHFVHELLRIDLPFQGASYRLLQGQGRRTVFVEFDRETVVPGHTHAEQ